LTALTGGSLSEQHAYARFTPQAKHISGPKQRERSESAAGRLENRGTLLTIRGALRGRAKGPPVRVYGCFLERRGHLVE